MSNNNFQGRRADSKVYYWVWWLIFLLLVAIAFVLLRQLKPLQKSLETSQPGLYAVTQFVDGDTIMVNMSGKNETVRMIGVDTPETHHPTQPIQCYGAEASDYTKQLIGSQKVRLQADPLDTNRDRYGRLLRYVYLTDGTLVEQKLISQGYGFAYTFFPFEKSQEFQAYEDAAKAAGNGLWSACQVEVESNGTHHTNAAN